MDILTELNNRIDRSRRLLMTYEKLYPMDKRDENQNIIVAYEEMYLKQLENEKEEILRSLVN